MVLLLPYARRCALDDLQKGDCPHNAVDGSQYCYWHRKVKDGLADPATEEVRRRLLTANSTRV